MNGDVKKFCEDHGITENQFYGKEQINRNLMLPSVKYVPEGFNPIIIGMLNLNSVEYLPEKFEPIITQGLYLHSVKSISNGFKPVVGGWLDLNSVQQLPNKFTLTVGEGLNLSSIKSIPKDINLTVGGRLTVLSHDSISEGLNLVTGGICFSSRNSARNMKVFSDFFSGNGNAIYTRKPTIMSWREEKYIKANGLLFEVISKENNFWNVKTLNNDKIYCLVTDGNGKYAHGDTLDQAYSSLETEPRRNRDIINCLMHTVSQDSFPTKYKNLTLESSLSCSDAIDCYKRVTGACDNGVNNFIQTKLNGYLKESYKIHEIIKLTENQYGHHTFKVFINDLKIT